MTVKSKKMITTIFTIVAILITILLFWLTIGGESLAKLKNEASDTKKSAEIAESVFRVDGDQMIKIDGKEETVYHFSVKNYDETKMSEVDLNYDIEILNASSSDLEFELSQNGKPVNLDQNKTDLFCLSPFEKQKHDYILRIIYQNQPANFEEIEGSVQIKTQAIQTRKIEEG